jgi:predicted membrane protein
MHNREQRVTGRVSKRRENITGGLLLLGIGSLLLARQVGADLPSWLFTWPMILIVVGLFVGIKTRFRDFGWLLLIGIGVFFLLDKAQFDTSIRKFIWPAAIIAAGLIILLSALFKRPQTHIVEDAEEVGDENPQKTTKGAIKDDIMEVICVFGSTTRVVLSKALKGGEVISVFGSSEINLTNADFKGKLVLEVIQVFGGTKLIIPPHWEVQSQTAVIFGGIDDKRSNEHTSDPEKILVIDGVTFFGGITITRY